MKELPESQGLNCKELVELVTDYLEAAMLLQERERFEQHLEHCPGCRSYVDQIRATIRFAGSLTEDNIPTDARDGLLQVFRDWKAGSST